MPAGQVRNARRGRIRRAVAGVDITRRVETHECGKPGVCGLGTVGETYHAVDTARRRCGVKLHREISALGGERGVLPWAPLGDRNTASSAGVYRQGHMSRVADGTAAAGE